MNFKIILVGILFLISNQIISGQNEEKKVHQNWYNSDDPETVYFTFGALASIPLNDSTLKDAGGPAGISLGFDWLVIPELTVGVYYDTQTTHISNDEDNDRTGAVKNINLNSFGLQLGYYKAINREWNWSLKAGVGIIGYKSRTGYDKFMEDGTSYKLSGEVGYRLNQTLALYTRIAPRYNKLNIEAVEEVQNYLNKHFLLDFGIGLRIHLHNPGG